MTKYHTNGRARILRPQFFTDEKLLEMEPTTRILFEALWIWADLHGVLEDKPKWIHYTMLPGPKERDANVDAMLQELHDAGLILRYEVDGKRYLWVRNWDKHQGPAKGEKQSGRPMPQFPEIAGNFPPVPVPVPDNESDDAPDGAKTPKKPRQTLSKPTYVQNAVAEWEKRFGAGSGGLMYGRLGKAFKALVAANGEEQVLAAWAKFLDPKLNDTEDKFLAPEFFAQRYAMWSTLVKAAPKTKYLQPITEEAS